MDYSLLITKTNIPEGVTKKMIKDKMYTDFGELNWIYYVKDDVVTSFRIIDYL